MHLNYKSIIKRYVNNERRPLNVSAKIPAFPYDYSCVVSRTSVGGYYEGHPDSDANGGI